VDDVQYVELLVALEVSLQQCKVQHLVVASYLEVLEPLEVALKCEAYTNPIKIMIEKINGYI